MKRLALAAMAALALSAGMAQAQSYADMGGQQVRIATTLTVLEPTDRALMERLRAEIFRLRRMDPLPYRTLADIPDARTLGYGDCKSFSVAMREALKEQGFAPDSLLLARAITERGDLHMVLLIRVRDGRDERTLVFDSRVEEITDVEALIRHGYRFEGRESAPGGPLVNWNGHRFL